MTIEFSPYVRFAIDQRLPGSWQLDERIIFDYELLCIKEGEADVYVEQKHYAAMPGDVFLFKPNTVHSMITRSPDGLRVPHMHFDLHRLEDSEKVYISFVPREKMTTTELALIRQDRLPEMGISLPDKLPISDSKTLDQLMSDVIYEFENQMPFSSIDTQAAFLKLWSFVLRSSVSTGDAASMPHQTLMLEIRHYLNTNTNRPVQLDELTNRFNVSKYHLIRSFKRLFGVSPIKYNRLCRLEKAKNLVQHTVSSFTQIALDLGFESLSDFTRSFSNYYGRPPQEHRRAFRSASNECVIDYGELSQAAEDSAAR